jgi:hypothetical protein
MKYLQKTFPTDKKEEIIREILRITKLTDLEIVEVSRELELSLLYLCVRPDKFMLGGSIYRNGARESSYSC